jgi:Holliday junction DNA helicase RuvA
MIGSLKGRIEYRGNDHICVDVAGVGYIVYCSEKTLSTLPVEGEFITLFTDLVVREDLLQLFGFLTFAEKEWHRLLCSVQGVGAKGALAIQGILSVESLSRAILLSDWATIKTAPGVGPKIAQRIVNELKEKAPKVMAMGSIKSKKENQNTDVIDNMDNVMLNEELLDGKISKKENFQELQSDALSALVNLGYSQGGAASAIAQIVLEEDDYHVQDLIRNALKILAPKG